MTVHTLGSTGTYHRGDDHRDGPRMLIFAIALLLRLLLWVLSYMSPEPKAIGRGTVRV